jgi:hypothetical protein
LKDDWISHEMRIKKLDWTRGRVTIDFRKTLGEKRLGKINTNAIERLGKNGATRLCGASDQDGVHSNFAVCDLLTCKKELYRTGNERKCDDMRVIGKAIKPASTLPTLFGILFADKFVRKTSVTTTTQRRLRW